MKLLFAHDVIIKKRNDSNLHFSPFFKYSLWERYLKYFSGITVASRSAIIKKIEDDEQNLSSGPNVEFCEIPSISGPINMVKNRKKAISKLDIAIKKSDVIISRLPSEIGMLAISLAIKNNKPWAVEVVGHVWDSLWNYGSWQGKFYAPIATIRTKKYIEKAPYALYVTKKFLQEKYPSSGQMFECSDVMIDNVCDNEKALKRIGNKSKYTIGLIGSMAANYKGIDTAIIALNKVKEKGLDFEFRILGEGNKEPYIELMKKYNLQDNVVFSGVFSSGKLVLDWLDELDLYVQPSKTEGLPRALIEAMSRGIPAIASNVGGIPELLSKEYLVKPNDAISLSNTIFDVLSDRELRGSMALNNIQIAKQYTVEILEGKRRKFFESVSMNYGTN